MRTLTSGLVALMAAGLLLLAPARPAHAAACVPPQNAGSQAQCTFDVWGYVHHADGMAAASAYVTDDFGHAVYTDGNGFYDLYELATGRFRITASLPEAGCFETAWADDGMGAIVNGGARVDFTLPC